MDNKRALKKILDELNQEKPRLDYIKGMLEVLIGEEENIKGNLMTYSNLHNIAVEVVRESGSNVTVNGQSVIDEGAILDNVAKANLETVKRLSQQND